MKLPIENGTWPDTDLQVNNQKLENAYVDKDNQIKLLPNTNILEVIAGARAIFSSIFENRLFIATGDALYYYQDSALIEVGTFIHSSSAIRMAENSKGELGLVNGAGAWIFNQSTDAFIKLDTSNGFTLTHPTDIVALDTFLIMTGGKEKKWIVSEANDALNYNDNEVVETDTQLGDLLGVRALNNNLFIFGTGGVQRWIPSIERTPNTLPFSQDPNFEENYGLISTNSLVSSNNEILYLTANGEIRYINQQDYVGRTVTNAGLQEVLLSYGGLSAAYGSYFYYRGNYFYQLTFTVQKVALIYNISSGKFSNTDELIIGFAGEIVLKEDGIYDFTTDFSAHKKKVSLQTAYFYPKQDDLTQRSTLSLVILQLTQGKDTNNKENSYYLSISKDNKVFGNQAKITAQEVGNRLFQCRWFMNMVNTGFSVKFICYLASDITIQSAWVTIN